MNGALGTRLRDLITETFGRLSQVAQNVTSVLKTRLQFQIPLLAFMDSLRLMPRFIAVSGNAEDSGP